jgi:hypothetical protein
MASINGTVYLLTRGMEINMDAKKASSTNRRLKIILAIMIAGVVAIAALTYDGGNSSDVVKTAQNAADAGALGGVRYLSTVDVKNEKGLIAAINGIVEANGIPDSDGKGANEVNDNVAAYYTNENGDRISGCSEVGKCGSVPASASYIKVVVVNDFDPFVARVLGIESLGIAADAIVPLSSESA